MPQPTHRLIKLSGPAQFKAVLAAKTRVGGAGYFARALVNEAGASRLGVIAAKKSARRAVDRNRAKRLAREAFRAVLQNKSPSAPLDIVLGLRNDLRDRDNKSIRAELDHLLVEVIRKINPRMQA